MSTSTVKPFGRAEGGVDMTFDFGQLIAHAAKTRTLSAGTIIGSGTVSNKLDGGPGKSLSEGGAAYSCIAELRMIETIENGEAKTPFLQIRRRDAHRDAGRGRAFDLRRYRTDSATGSVMAHQSISTNVIPGLAPGIHAVNGPQTKGAACMAKQFASAATWKKRRFPSPRSAADLWAFTAEGDPNTGVIIGDDSVMIVEAQATPALANKVIEKVREVTDKPITHLVLDPLSRCARAREHAAYKADRTSS
jgi:hypothetical protein